MYNVIYIVTLARSYLYEVSANLPPSSSLNLENKRPLARETFDNSLSSKDTSNLNFFFFILPTISEQTKNLRRSFCHHLRCFANYVHISQLALRFHRSTPEISPDSQWQWPAKRTFFCGILLALRSRLFLSSLEIRKK